MSFDSSRIDGFGEPTLDLATYPTPPHSLHIPPWTAAQEPDQHIGGTVEVVSERCISWHLKRALVCAGKPISQFHTYFCKITHNSTLHFCPSHQPNHLFTKCDQIYMESSATLERHRSCNLKLSLPYTSVPANIVLPRVKGRAKWKTVSRPTLHPHTIYQTSGYPVSTLDHSSIYAYPTPHQNPGPDPFPGQIRPSLPGYPAPPDNSLPQIQARRHRAS